MDSLTDSESLAAVKELGDIVVATRKALAEAQAATAEALRIAGPLSEQNAAYAAQVASLEKSVAAFAKADADLDAAITANLARAKAPVAEPVANAIETNAGEPDVPVTTPVTDEAGAEVSTPSDAPASEASASDAPLTDAPPAE